MSRETCVFASKGTPSRTSTRQKVGEIGDDKQDENNSGQTDSPASTEVAAPTPQVIFSTEPDANEDGDKVAPIEDDVTENEEVKDVPACEAEQMDTTPAAEEEAVKVTFESENAIEDASNVEEKTNGNDQAVAVAPVKRKAEDETSPAKKTKCINGGFCLFVGNLNTSKEVEEINDALANFFTSHSLLFQAIRVDITKKFAYVDFHTEEDLTKALELDRVKILDQKIRLGKANVKDVTAEEKKAKDAKTLYVKNISFSATKEDLKKVFDTAVEIRFPRGIGRPSKGIAYIEFKTEAIAEKVLEEKQGTDVQGRVIVIDFLGEKSQQQKMINAPAEATPNNELLVTNLAYTAKEDALRKIFLKAVSVRIPQSSGKPRGHAFIQFESVEDAKEAMESSLNKEICGRAIGVKFSQKRPEGDQENSVPSKTLMVRNLAKETSEETLKSSFEGAIEARVTKDKETGESRGFGFVDFESIEVCKAVKEAVVDLQIDGSKVTLIYATPQGERGPRGEGPGFNRSFRGKPGGRGGGRGRGRGGGFRGGRGGRGGGGGGRRT
ncbi:nucleolin isoform X3 [Oncorhynchus tshawytscha]|uniref:nucleolin isoform X3 n=1 Tax=Oncorhynchus tshawytscha TaxID=74940 RepID=UPI000D0A457D|nr:nucleolin isoform X3 [Oncorhynchus tshawytscha]